MSESDAQLNAGLTDRRWLIVEAVVIAMVGVVPHLLNSFASYFTNSTESSTEIIASYLGHIGSSLGIIAVALFIAWSNPDGIGAFGLKRFRFLDAVHALAILAAAYMSLIVYSQMASPIYWAIHQGTTEDPYTFHDPTTVAGFTVAAIALALNGAAEELVLWSVLFTRLAQLSNNKPLSVAIVACTFASYHLYQGVFAMGGVVFMGLVFGGYFAWRGRIWPLIIAHALWDILLLI